MHELILFGGGLLAAAMFMSVLWLRQRMTGNAGIVDVGWALTIATLGICFAALGTGWAERRLLAGIMAGLWGFRLAWYIHARSHGKPEDGRYSELRGRWAPHAQAKLFQFFQLQAVVATLFAGPFLLAAANPAERFHPLELCGGLLWLAGLLGESVADAQLGRFKRNPANRGLVCTSGLWSWSRHPNYFFEWLVWCGIALFACMSPLGWLSLLSPTSILYFLLRVTGIPATEEQALRTKGDAYRAYQRTTNAFVPWFPKRG